MVKNQATIDEYKRQIDEINKLADEFEQNNKWNYTDCSKAFMKVLEIIGRKEAVGKQLL